MNVNLDVRSLENIKAGELNVGDYGYCEINAIFKVVFKGSESLVITSNQKFNCRFRDGKEESGCWCLEYKSTCKGCWCMRLDKKVGRIPKLMGMMEVGE